MTGEGSVTRVPVYLLGCFAADYIMVLETEIRNLKHKFKTLEGQVENVLDPSKMSSSHSDVQASVHILAEVPGKSPCLVLLNALFREHSGFCICFTLF